MYQPPWVSTGDFITLTMDFRFEALPTVSSTDGLRFGLYNTNGTNANTNGGAASDNDFGYQARIGTGTTAGFGLNKENINNTAGELGAGNDRVALTVVNPGDVAINDTLKHSLSFTITKTSAGVDVSAAVDGSPLGTGTSTVPYLTFDEILISHATPQAYRVDNVLVTSNVPEPGTLGVIGAGMLLLGRRRRMRK